jgi:hypothetical protein
MRRVHGVKVTRLTPGELRRPLGGQQQSADVVVVATQGDEGLNEWIRTSPNIRWVE